MSFIPGHNPLLAGSHLLRALGLEMDTLAHSLEHGGYALEHLAASLDVFGLSPNALGSLISDGALPPSMYYPGPDSGHCPCGQHYAPTQEHDFGASRPGANFIERYMNRRSGGQFERMVNRDPFARQQLEMMLGGRIISDGRNDGRIAVQPFPVGYFPAGGANNAAAFEALGLLDAIARASGAAGGGPAAFNSAILGALAGVHDALFGGGSSGYGDYRARHYGGNGPRGGPNVAPSEYERRSGWRNGEYMPGSNGVGNDSGMTVSQVLNDPSLTVEDKVVLMLMIIMKNMDKEIEKQAEYIEKIQQQKDKEAKGGKGGKSGKSSPSIDVETMKLKRLIDKRSQMFDMLRQIIDKYNETAKNIIQSIGR